MSISTTVRRFWDKVVVLVNYILQLTRGATRGGWNLCPSSKYLYETDIADAIEFAPIGLWCSFRDTTPIEQFYNNGKIAIQEFSSAFHNKEEETSPTRTIQRLKNNKSAGNVYNISIIEDDTDEVKNLFYE
uniref:Uncharacterized protein n=1 Tax=Megaselia scalaris TaxID=36166 RepID=T1GTT6_MEGSC